MPRACSLKPAALAVSLCFSTAASALPTDPVVVSGQATFSQSGNALTIQNSANAVLNWRTFSIGAGEIVKFIQPSASSAVLNRVVGRDPSLIYGQLQSNGKVWLINPNGILVGPTGRIDTAGFVASTLQVSDANFLAGKLLFQKDVAVPGSVVNQGTITTPSGGQLYLIAPEVRNEGVISAPNGEVILAAGQNVQLMDTGTPGVKVEIAGDGTATNLGSILAAAGQIGMAAALVKNAGTINASTVVNEGGRVFLRASKSIELTSTSAISADGAKGGNIVIKTADDTGVVGTLVARGTVSAQGDGSAGSGGFVETSAGSTDLNGFRITTGGGQWLIDPMLHDFNIASSGGDISGADLALALASNSVIIQSGSVSCTNATCGGGTAGVGDINVNDTVSWSANTLTLNAFHNININSTMNGSGTASLALQYGQGAVAAGNTATYNVRAPVNLPSGNHFSTKLGSDGVTNNYMVITSLGVAGDTSSATLQGMANNLSGKYVLGADIDASGTATWNANGSGGYYGFSPIGTSAARFTGAFDGLGHRIHGLTINRPIADVGLFGRTSGSISNVGLINVNIIGTGSMRVGGLASWSENNSIINSYVSGNVTGTNAASVGGLVGSASGVSIVDSYVAGAVTGTHSGYVGGLVGDGIGITITSSYVAATVSLPGASGGNTNTYLGGLAGYITNATISDSYVAGNVIGSSAVYQTGGLVGGGGIFGASTIDNSYFSGAILGAANTCCTYVGGVVGGSAGGYVMVNNSFWDTTINPDASLDNGFGGTGQDTTAMRTQGSFTGWNFGATWRMPSGGGTPLLRIVTTLVPSATVVSKTYDGGTAATVNVGPLSLLPGDSVTLAGVTANFVDPSTGTGKAVTATYTLGGADAAWYRVANLPLSGDIVAGAPAGSIGNATTPLSMPSTTTSTSTSAATAAAAAVAANVVTTLNGAGSPPRLGRAGAALLPSSPAAGGAASNDGQTIGGAAGTFGGEAGAGGSVGGTSAADKDSKSDDSRGKKGDRPATRKSAKKCAA